MSPSRAAQPTHENVSRPQRHLRPGQVRRSYRLSLRRLRPHALPSGHDRRGLAEALPYLVLGLLGGAVADRVRRARLNMVADAGRGSVEAAVFVWHLSGGLPLAVLYAAVAAIRVAGCFANPARRALVAQVAAGSDLTAANGPVGTTGYGASILGPAVAAVLLAAGGLGAFFAFGACTYLLSAVLVSVLSRPLSEQPAAPRPAPQAPLSILRSVVSDLWAFARVLRASRQLLLLSVLSASAVVFYTWAWQIGIVVKSHQLSPTSSTETYTVLMAVFAASVVVTGLLVPWWRQRLGLRHYLVSMIVWGVGLAMIGELHGEIGVAAMVVVMGAGVSIGSQTRLYLLQTEVPQTVVARAYGAYSVTM